MNNYNEIKGIIDEYIKLMDKLIDFEREKLQAIKEKNISLLDNFLKEEQAYLLQLKGLDHKRESTQKHLGIEGLTYRQIIDKIDKTEGSLRIEFEKSYEILSTKTKQFKEVLNTIKTYVDVRLHTIDSVMDKLGGLSPQNNHTGIYNKISSETKNIHNQSKKFESTKV